MMNTKLVNGSLDFLPQIMNKPLIFNELFSRIKNATAIFQPPNPNIPCNNIQMTSNSHSVLYSYPKFTIFMFL